MPVSKLEWNAMSWKDRIATITRDRGISITQLAAELGVSHSSLSQWSRGSWNPTQPYCSRLMRMGVYHDTIDLDSECYTAFASKALDPSESLFRTALASHDKIMLSIAAHCVAAKAAAMITDFLRTKVLVRFNSIFNSFPVVEEVAIDVLGHPEISIVLTVSHAVSNAEAFTLTCLCLRSGVKTATFSAYATDAGLLTIITKIAKHIQLLCKRRTNSNK